jgi:hypothetical protein
MKQSEVKQVKQLLLAERPSLCSSHTLQLEKVYYCLRNRQKYNQDRTTLILAPSNRFRMDKAAKLIKEAIDILELIN